MYILIKSISRLTLSSLHQKTQSRTVLRYFLAFDLFPFFFFLKVMVPQVPQIPLVLEVPRFADLHFSNPLYDNQTCSNYYEDICFTNYDPQTIMRTTR